ncbi:LacI family DNA-binding transcriptional regulator [Feifania hominis]|uniref:Substrate-binding domain-containing protein n=1 Tax=Feifania hominis TaxID=2763660 RepID=A0A926DHG3_9FIRM|nr:substrate-binding domain-containing protein [Feifania hominis]MBC8537150.1 substrate-binding domain-containing protein [Feifania hominis]
MIDRSIRIRDIARRAGVSPATVSRVLNKTGNVSAWTTAAVLKEVEQAGIVLPAPQSDGGEKREAFPTVIIAVPDNNNNPFYSEIIAGISDSVQSKGYVPMVYTSHLRLYNYKKLLEYAAFIRAVGIISLYRIDDAVSDEISKSIPFVQCCSQPESPSIPYVCVNDKAAAKVAAQHLIQMGCDRLAVFAHSGVSKITANRVAGFMEAADEAKIQVPPNWLLRIPHINYKAAYSAAKQLFNRDRIPNGIFAITDVAAIAVLNAAQDSHIRVPNDVMIVGFDNLEMSEITRPSLTTINQPRYEIGFAAGEMMYDCVTNPDTKPNNIVFNCELIVRGSTSAK